MGSSGKGTNLQAHSLEWWGLRDGGQRSGELGLEQGCLEVGVLSTPGLQVEHGTGLLQEALSVCLWLFSSRWVRVWTNLRVEKPHYSDQEEECGKCELTGCGGGWREQGRGPWGGARPTWTSLA